MLLMLKGSELVVELAECELMVKRSPDGAEDGLHGGRGLGAATVLGSEDDGGVEDGDGVVDIGVTGLALAAGGPWTSSRASASISIWGIWGVGGFRTLKKKQQEPMTSLPLNTET
ncbi:uncharacterized protein A4U43_UnF11970 [Asparagus officinalis]|uniref:Uncharacterized protein n=1 Tax=Asparagus officinalis TaxID=4686 RepID=A0A1R3L558_ASPOF|nr:uncharacterized protein A4U43_UnF11970 [Asparagus officinalis]